MCSEGLCHEVYNHCNRRGEGWRCPLHHGGSSETRFDWQASVGVKRAVFPGVPASGFGRAVSDEPDRVSGKRLSVQSSVHTESPA